MRTIRQKSRCPKCGHTFAYHRGVYIKKRPPFPLGCAIILYATMNARRVAEQISKDTYPVTDQTVVNYLKDNGIRIRRRGETA
jgi:hypothetical protein